MNPIESKKVVSIFTCSRCGETFYREELAASCCSTNYCKTCGKPLKNHYVTQCKECSTLDNARKCDRIPVEIYQGEMVVGIDGGFYNTEDVISGGCPQACEDKGFVFGCSFLAVRLDPDAIIDNILEEHDEDVVVSSTDELMDFVERWNAKQTDGSFFPDGTVVVIDEAAFENYITSRDFKNTINLSGNIWGL